MKQINFEVLSEDADSRIDRYLAQQMPDQSRSFLQKLIREEQITVNGRPVKANYRLQPEDQVLVIVPDPQLPDILPENIPLDILYEDSDVLVINKPKGMVVHPAAGHYTNTVVNAVMYHCQGNLSGINGVMRPGIVHRIDMDTTGAIIACKNDLAHASIAAQLKEHTITRRYEAIVCGVLKDDTGTIDAPIGRSQKDRKKMAVLASGGREAVTHYRVLNRFREYTHIECRLETGRTHQIRVHMASLGHPLLGDAVYGPAKCPYKLQGQTLHAGVLGFHHPRTGAYMEFTAPLPDYFKHLLEILK